MDLVAGDVRDIVLALSVEDTAAFEDPDRFRAHLALGAGLGEVQARGPGERQPERSSGRCRRPGRSWRRAAPSA